MTPVVKKESSKEINPSKLEEYQEESEPESIITGDQKEENTALNFEDKELVRVGLIDARKTVHIALNGLFSVFNNQKLIFSNLDKNEKWIISAKNNGSIAATSNLTGKKIEIKGKLRYLPQRKGSLTEIYKIKIGKGWHWQENKNLQFRGIIEFINYKGKLIVVNELPLDQYLYGVVPAEIHHSAPIEALKAQAILARTNIYASLGKKSLGKPYLIFSDVFSQVYKGLKCESEVSNEAVDQTSGLILTYKGKPIDAVFHSTSGGFMEANSAVWNGGQKEYLIAHPDFPLGKEPYTDLRNEKIFRKWIDSRPNSYCNMDFRDFPEKFSYAKKYFRWQQSYKRAALEKIIRKKAGINTIELASKEGLALINGTQIMTAIGALTLYDAINLAKIADLAGALTGEALNSITKAYDSKVHELRGCEGQIDSAYNLRKLLKNSDNSKRENKEKVQDSYSLRCIPQVHGGSRAAFNYVYDMVINEINAVTDNPLIFPDEDQVISGGNFHGQPMAIAFDCLKVAISELANISERRAERLINPQLSEGLPPFLTEHGGLCSGFMIAQYSAASMVSENKIYAHPASVDSITSSGNQEDHVSMGTTSARTAKLILDNAQKVIGIELFAAFQAISLRNRGGLGEGTKIAFEFIGSKVKPVDKDIIMHYEMIKFDEMIKNNTLLEAVEEKVGKLK